VCEYILASLINDAENESDKQTRCANWRSHLRYRYLGPKVYAERACKRRRLLLVRLWTTWKLGLRTLGHISWAPQQIIHRLDGKPLIHPKKIRSKLAWSPTSPILLHKVTFRCRQVPLRCQCLTCKNKYIEAFLFEGPRLTGPEFTMSAGLQ
jgi:hypothetical protein